MHLASPLSNQIRRSSLFLLIAGLLLVTWPRPAASVLPPQTGGASFPEVPRGAWLDVPYVRQQGEGCGAACIAMILRYWAENGGISVPTDLSDPQEIAKALHKPKARGIQGTQMEDFLHRQGYRTWIIQSSLSDLAHHLRKGRPLIVCIKPERNHSRLHYLVVAGIMPDEDVVLVNDPAQRKLLKLNARGFERDWAQTNRWTLLAVPAPSGSGNELITP